MLYNDLAQDPFKDIMAGVDTLIERGLADPKSLAIGGWSYGGYLTAWTTTQTDRFKAAIVSAGMVDLIPYACNTETAVLYKSYYGGDFWQNYKGWLHDSPIMHVEKIKTPTLIQNGDKDTIVPIDQALELCRTLKARDIPVRIIAYKGQGHGLGGKAAIIGGNDVLS